MLKLMLVFFSGVFLGQAIEAFIYGDSIMGRLFLSAAVFLLAWWVDRCDTPRETHDTVHLPLPSERWPVDGDHKDD